METENCVTEKMRNIQNMTILMVQVMEEKNATAIPYIEELKTHCEL